MRTMLDNLIAWCRVERADLQKMLDLMESGKMTIHNREFPGSDRDITAQRIEEIKASIAEPDEILSRKRGT